MKISYALLMVIFAGFTAFSEMAGYELKCNKMEPDEYHVNRCTNWSLCKEEGKACTTWGPLSWHARDELRDYLLRNKAEIAKRKAGGKIYVECLEMDGSQRCNLAYLSQKCTAPKGGRCSVILESAGKVATCDALDGATCTASVRLRLEDFDAFREQMKLAKS